MRAGLLPMDDECWSWDHVEAVCQMLLTVSSLDSNRARIVNGVGFSKQDSARGHELAAAVSQGGMTKGQLLAAKAMLRKYHRQIDPELYRIVYPDHDDPAAA